MRMLCSCQQQPSLKGNGSRLLHCIYSKLCGKNFLESHFLQKHKNMIHGYALPRNVWNNLKLISICENGIVHYKMQLWLKAYSNLMASKSFLLHLPLRCYFRQKKLFLLWNRKYSFHTSNKKKSFLKKNTFLAKK